MSNNERVRLAQELHDGIAQDLVGLGYCIDSLVAESNTPIHIRAKLRAIRFTTSALVDKVRQEIFALRTTQTNALEQSTGMPDPIIELEKIVTELLRNVEAHSMATSITIDIHDNGIGGVKEKVGHHGLIGVSERVHNLGSQVRIDSSEVGTDISITVPWK